MAQLPPAAEAANIRQPSTTYQQLLADRTHDAVWDNPRAYLAGYRFANEQAGAEAIPAPVALLDQTVLLSDRQPMTFLCLVPRRNTYLVYVLHRFMWYLELPGERPTGFDDQVMALLGDIRPAQIPVVDVPPTTFHLAATAMVRIPTHAAMLAAGVPPANSVAADLLGPFGGDNDEGTELARPRHVQLIPSRYATDLVSEDGVHPQLVYQNLSAALVRDGTLEDCRDVLTWLRTASTARGGAGVQAGVPAVALSFPGLNLPQPVYQYVLSKVHGDLPALRSGLAPPAAAAFMPGAQHVADLMRAFAEGQAQRPDNAAHEREPKQVQDVYRETYQLLLRYSRVEQVDDLAPVWRRLASAAKSEQQTVLSQELTSVCLARGLAPEFYAPVVSTSLKQMISGFAFAGTGPNELAGGCSPFLVTYTGARALQEAQDSAALTHQLEQGSQNASLADIRSIKDKERVRFPRDLHNVGITLQRYAVLLQCLFQGAGPPHPLVRSIWALADDFSTKLPFLLDSHQNLSREHPQAFLQLPVRILRYVQVVVIEYLQRIATAAAGFVKVDNAPRFNDLVQDLQWGTFHVSRNWIALPPYYAQLAFPSTSALTPTGRRLPGSDTTNTTTGSSGSSLNTGVSSLTSPSTTAPTQVRVVNETPDAEFMALELKPRLGELLRLHRPPASSDGGEHCVAWWAKGGCYSQCSRRSTHKAFSSPGERARLLAHIKEHLVVAQLLPFAAPVAPAPVPHQVEPDLISTSLSEHNLGKSSLLFASELARLGSWDAFVSSLRRAPDISPQVRRLPHKAGRLLDHLRRRGAPVPLKTPPWSTPRLHQAVQRGPHRSAHQHVEFVCAEIQDFCDQGFWTVLPLDVALSIPNLRVSPLGVVPQRDRRPRLIVDYTFSGVNQETVRLAPPEAMQFGRALQRLLSHLVHANPRFGPAKLAKIDVADGFYRVGLRTADIPKLGVILPHSHMGSPLIAFPLALPMGWVESPPFFTALTETACDLANAAQSRRSPSEVHPLESVSQTPAPDALPFPRFGTLSGWSARTASFDAATVRTRPLAVVDVYVDDFLLAAQTHREQGRLLRRTLHAIDAVFRPLSPTDPPSRKHPASLKKMQQGGAHWAYRKRMLGWVIDTVRETLELPPHRLSRLYSILDELRPPRKRMAIAKWHQLLGELRSMSLAIPGSTGLFSVLQDTLRRGDQYRVRLNRHVYNCASDFRALADSLGTRPTHFRELVPLSPSDIGACDACRLGMGGVWFDALTPASHPILWRAPFPDTIRASLVTADCRHGTVSISDLELAATIAHKAVLATTRHVQERTLWLHGDNRAAIAWATKGASSTSTARAYLLRLNSLLQRAHRYHARHHYIPGALNSMADDANRLLAHLPAAARPAACRDWGAISDTLRASVSPHRCASQDTSWRVWASFCAGFGHDPGLPAVRDRVPLLQLFAHRYRTGVLAPGGLPVRSRTVEDAVRAVGQTFSRLGAPDPRLTSLGVLDYRLASLFRAWSKADPSPTRVPPLPLSVLRLATSLTRVDPAAVGSLAVADCVTFAFYFLLRPGEYAGTPRTTRDDLFRLRDVHLWAADTPLDPLTCSLGDLATVTFLSLTFTTQKNGVRGERVGHSRSGDPILCPVVSVLARLRHLRAHHAGLDTPLNAYHHLGRWHYVLPSAVTALPRLAASAAPTSLGFDPALLSARSTRSGGAPALLHAGVDGDRIRLLGWWRSDEMYRYLHVQSQPTMSGIAAAMLRGAARPAGLLSPTLLVSPPPS